MDSEGSIEFETGSRHATLDTGPLDFHYRRVHGDDNSKKRENRLRFYAGHSWHIHHRHGSLATALDVTIQHDSRLMMKTFESPKQVRLCPVTGLDFAVQPRRCPSFRLLLIFENDGSWIQLQQLAAKPKGGSLIKTKWQRSARPARLAAMLHW